MTVTGRRGLDIGRDAHLDWTLPDPTRFISAKHWFKGPVRMGTEEELERYEAEFEKKTGTSSVG